MLPDNVLSTEVIDGDFTFPRNIPRQPLIDFEYGGVALNDPSGGLRVKVWRGEIIEGEVILSASSVAPVSVLTIVGEILDFGFSFDSNMNVFVTWELATGTAFFYWFDSLASAYTTTQLPLESLTPRCAIDDSRDIQVRIGNNDIILAYCREGSLYFRAQRERYQVEHLLDPAVGNRGLIQIGMNSKNRFQFQMTTS